MLELRFTLAAIHIVCLIVCWIYYRRASNLARDFRKEYPTPPLPPISVEIWKAKDGWRWKAGFLVVGTLDEVDWKCDSTESYDTEREAEANMQVFVCRGWEPVKVREDKDA